jgi:hypothetical protein
MSSSSLDRLKEKYEEYREYCKTILPDADDVLAVEGDYTEAVTGLGSSHSWDEVRIRESESQESL